jgi:hypothetical protein
MTRPDVESPGRGQRGDTDTTLERRALARWPRLEPAALRRCRHDPRRIAALVARRTSIPPEAIVELLSVPIVTDDDVITWFG